MKKYALVILGVCTLCVTNWSTLTACTSAIISGKVTPDGRPIMWKNRDTGNLRNCVRFLKGEKYDYIGVTSYEANPKSVWIGTNEVGFSIMNTVSYNLIDQEEDESLSGKNNGSFMKRALEICGNMTDFRQYLDTLSRPLFIEANFGVIDAEGNGAYFEVDNTNYTEFNVDDPKAAPHGYIVRTNFSVSGKFNEGAGYIRYQQAEQELFTVAATNGVTPDWLFNRLSRSFANPLMGIDLTNGQFNKPHTNGWFVEQDFIARRKTSCAVAVQGVKPGEDASFTTMWTVIGYPPVTPLVPVWVKGAEKKLPRLITVEKSDDKNYCPLSDQTGTLRDRVYAYKQGSNAETYFNWELLFNAKGEGFMQLNRNIEAELWTSVYDEIDSWRTRKQLPVDEVYRIYDEADQQIAQKFKAFYRLEL